MKKLIYILSVVLVFTCTTSCQLESESYDSVNNQIFPKTEADANSLVIANFYGPFHSNAWLGGNGIFRVDRGWLLVSDLMSDYGECSWRGWESVLYNSWTNADNINGVSGALWGYSNFLGKITLNMDRIENIPGLDATIKNKYMAEGHLARGWLAFFLYDMFGPVPVADLETLKNPLAEKILPRLSEDEMKTFIESELKEAEQNLPISYGEADYGRFTKGLANMILLKFYMQTAQWDKAEAVGKELTKPEYGYELVTQYRDIFTAENQGNKETIWAVNCLRGTNIQTWTPHILPPDYPTEVKTNKWGGFKISWNKIKTFEPGDDRLNSIVVEYTSATVKDELGQFKVHNFNNDHESGDNGAMLYWGALPNKYPIDPGTTGNDSEINLIVYRYADAITLLAEAIVRNANSVTQEAVDLLNRVRVRAHLQQKTLSDFPTVESFLDAVLEERGHELFFEGCRRQDLIRHGKYVDMVKEKSTYAGIETLVSPNYYRLPIPQRIIDEGKGQIIQNPGY